MLRRDVTPLELARLIDAEGAVDAEQDDVAEGEGHIDGRAVDVTQLVIAEYAFARFLCDGWDQTREGRRGNDAPHD